MTVNQYRRIHKNYIWTFSTGFSGGGAILQMGGTDAQGRKCITRLPINLPFCAQFNRSQLKVTTFEKTPKFGLQPNPTSGLVKIVFENTDTTAVTIYDLLGKKLAAKQCNTSNGTWDFDSTAMAQGVYIVVFKNENEILSQQKLIKN